MILRKVFQLYFIKTGVLLKQASQLCNIETGISCICYQNINLNFVFTETGIPFMCHWNKYLNYVLLKKISELCDI